MTPAELEEREKQRNAEEAVSDAHFKRIETIHNTVLRFINNLLPSEQRNGKYKQPRNFWGKAIWTLTTQFKKLGTLEFELVTWANDLVNNENDEMVDSHLYITEQSNIKLTPTRVNLTLKENDEKTVFPFLRGTPGATEPEVLTNTIKRVLLGFLPIHRIFRGFDRWTHTIGHEIQNELYVISVKSRSGFYERNTVIEYKNSDYYQIYLTMRRTREGNPIKPDEITDKIRKYLETQQWNLRSRYEAQTERITLMLKTYAS